MLCIQPIHHVTTTTTWLKKIQLSLVVRATVKTALSGRGYFTFTVGTFHDPLSFSVQGWWRIMSAYFARKRIGSGWPNSISRWTGTTAKPGLQSQLDIPETERQALRSGPSRTGETGESRDSPDKKVQEFVFPGLGGQKTRKGKAEPPKTQCVTVVIFF